MARRGLVLAIILLLELGICLLVFHKDTSNAALLLFAAGAIATLFGFWQLLRVWQRTRAGLTRFAFSLLIAFVAFQVALILFTLFVALGSHASPFPAVLVILIVANAFFFPIWIVLGTLTFGLLRLLLGGKPG